MDKNPTECFQYQLHTPIFLTCDSDLKNLLNSNVTTYFVNILLTKYFTPGYLAL